MRSFFRYLIFSLVFLFLPFQAQARIKVSTRVSTTTTSRVSFSVKERIWDFSAKIRINLDGSVDVKEKIIYDFGLKRRHGIFRYIPYVYYIGNKDYELEFENFQVYDEVGRPYKFKISKTSKDYYLKIGDPDKLISGIHTYIISYKVKGAIRYFKDHDEFAWDVVGAGWRVPIEKARAEVFLPEKVAGRIKAFCFTGSFGSKGENCQAKAFWNKAEFESLEELGRGRGFTIAVSFPKNIVAYAPAKEKIDFFEDTLIGKILSVLFFLALFLALLFWYLIYPVKIALKWWKQGRDPKPKLGEVQAWFSPPKLKGRYLRPAEVGTLIDERVNNRDIFATIVDLAIRGYLKIKEEKKKGIFGGKDFVFEKTEKPWDGLLGFEKRILKGIFRKKAKVKLSDLSKDGKVAKYLNEAKTSLYSLLVSNGLLDKNPYKTRKFYYSIMAVAAFTLNPLLFLSSLIFGTNLPKKTELGVELALQAKGLKRFLVSQDEKLEFQAKNLQFFEKLLPYAIVFRVEKIWIERFKDLLEKNPEQIYWYSSSGKSFSVASFQTTLSSLDSQFSSSTSSYKASSGSFSSGGGFSGGGFGGGGGGSW